MWRGAEASIIWEVIMGAPPSEGVQRFVGCSPIPIRASWYKPNENSMVTHARHPSTWKENGRLKHRVRYIARLCLPQKKKKKVSRILL